jgi:hypothetical protein
MSPSTITRKGGPAPSRALREAANGVDLSGCGAAMAALPSENERLFVYHMLTLPPGRGRQVKAYRLAGYASSSTPAIAAKCAYLLANRPRIQAAMAEEGRKYFRASAPEAVNATMALVRNPSHKDHARAIAMVLDRSDPLTTIHRVAVNQTFEHRVTATPEVLERIEKLARRFGLDTSEMPALLDAPVIEGTAERVE